VISGGERFFGRLSASERDSYDEDAVNAQIGISDWRGLLDRPVLQWIADNLWRYRVGTHET
jgi:hypothetical protein